MLKLKRFAWATLGLLVLSTLSPTIAIAKSPDPPIPSGFRRILSSTGVDLYQKDYPRGNPDYVQVIDLSQGASIKLLHGPITDARSGKGAFGGDDPRFKLKSLPDYWKDLKESHSNAFCVTNGQFFYIKESPTRLPFPLKQDGVFVSSGYGIKDFPDQKMILEIWGDQADIELLSRHSLYSSSAPDIIAGLAENANKSANKSVGRTFVGVEDQDQDGENETILIFSTLTARQVDAAAVLRSFGAEKVMMLDGGGSAQLLCRGTSIIKSDRPVPQAIGILAGVAPPLPAFSATLVSQPGWPILIEGESFEGQIEVKNSGSETWKAGEVQIALEERPGSPSETIPVQNDARPQETVRVTWQTAGISPSGVYSATWYLVHGGEKFSGAPARFHYLVIPKELEDKRGELEGKISLWTKQPEADIEQLLTEWIQIQSSQAKNDLPGAAWVPLSMLPIMAILFFAINKKRLRKSRRRKKRKKYHE